MRPVDRTTGGLESNIPGLEYNRENREIILMKLVWMLHRKETNSMTFHQLQVGNWYQTLFTQNGLWSEIWCQRVTTQAQSAAEWSHSAAISSFIHLSRRLKIYSFCWSMILGSIKLNEQCNYSVSYREATAIIHNHYRQLWMKRDRMQAVKPDSICQLTRQPSAAYPVKLRCGHQQTIQPPPLTYNIPHTKMLSRE